MILNQISKAKLISEIGNSFRFMLIPIGILSITNNDTAAVALLEVFETGGLIIAGILAPFFVDRINKIKGLVILDALATLLICALIFSFSIKNLLLVYTISFFITFIDFIVVTLLNSTIANSIKDDKDFVLGFSKIQFFTLAGGLLGSILGGGIADLTQAHYLLIIDAVTFLISSILILKVISGLPEKARATQFLSFSNYIKGLLFEWREGLNEALAYQQTRLLLLERLITGVAHGLLNTATVSHLKTNLGASNKVVMLWQATNRAWFLLGSAVVYFKKFSERKSIILGFPSLVIGYALRCIPNLWTFISIGGLQQFGTSVLKPSVASIVLRSARPELRGRVESIRHLTIQIGVFMGNILGLLTIQYLSLQHCFYFCVGIISLNGLVFFSNFFRKHILSRP